MKLGLTSPVSSKDPRVAKNYYHKSEQDQAHSQKPGGSYQELDKLVRKETRPLSVVSQEAIERKFSHIKISARKTLPAKVRPHLRLNAGKTVIKQNQLAPRPRRQNERGMSKKQRREIRRDTRRDVDKEIDHKDIIEKRLQCKSPWFNSIMDPLTGADVKIPDETGTATGTMQVVFRKTITASGTGLSGFCVVSPYPNSVQSLGEPASNYQVVSHTQGAGIIRWAQTELAPAGSFAAFPSNQALVDYARGCRIVSASVTVQPEMSGLNDQGEMTCFSLPFAFHGDQTQDSFYKNLYNSSIVPINTKKAAISRWYPYHKDQLNYKAFFNTDKDSIGDREQDVPYWNFGVLCTGLQPGSSLVVQTTINYEFLPKRSVENIVDASPSVDDSMDHELTLKYIQDEPMNGTLPSHEVDRSPASANPPQDEEGGPTGFGMFAEVVKEIVPAVLPMLGALL